QHPQQGALAAAGHGEDAHALALARGHHRVDRAHAGGERALDQVAGQRIGRGGIDRHVDAGTDRAAAVNRFAVRIEDPAEQARPRAHRRLAPAGDDLGGGGNPVERAQRREQRVLPGHADDFGGEIEGRVAIPRRVAQMAQLADRGLQSGGTDQRAVGLDDAADPLDRFHPRQRAQQRVERLLARRLHQRARQVHRSAPAAPTPASATRLASICWATPARTSPASDTTTQLSGSRLSSSTSSITPTAGCAWRTAPRPACTDARTSGCTRISRNCSACAASTACITSGGTTLDASKPGAILATIAQASSEMRPAASPSTRARRSLSEVSCWVICCCARRRPSAKPSACPASRAWAMPASTSSYSALTRASSASSSSSRAQCWGLSTRADKARSNALRSNTATLPPAASTTGASWPAMSRAGALVSIAALVMRDHHQQRLLRQVRRGDVFGRMLQL